MFRTISVIFTICMASLLTACSTQGYKTGDLSFEDLREQYANQLINKYEYASTHLRSVMVADAERTFHKTSEELQKVLIENYPEKHALMVSGLLAEFTRIAVEGQAKMMAHAYTLSELQDLAYALPVMFERGTGYISEDEKWLAAQPALEHYQSISQALNAYIYTRASVLFSSSSSREMLSNACVELFASGDSKKALPTCIQNEFVHGTHRLILGELYRRQEPIENNVFLAKAMFTRAFVIDKQLEGLFYFSVLSVMHPVSDIERDLGYCGLRQAEAAGHKKAAEAADQALANYPAFGRLNCQKSTSINPI